MSRSQGNSLCKDTGHDWMLTVAENWRWCKRERCPASQRLGDGKWISNAKLYRFYDPMLEHGKRQRAPKQGAMWETERGGSSEEYLR